MDTQRPIWYRLEGQTPVPATLDEVAFISEPWRVALTHVGRAGLVSTVFLAADHNFSGIGAPILFETLIFGGRLDGERWRYRTWPEAESHHWRVVESLLRQARTMTKKIFRYQRALS